MHKLVPEGGSMTKHIIRGSRKHPTWKGDTFIDGPVTFNNLFNMFSMCSMRDHPYTRRSKMLTSPPQAPDTQPQQTGPYFSYHIINIAVISGEMINRTQNVFLFPQAPKQTDIIRRKTGAHRAPNI